MKVYHYGFEEVENRWEEIEKEFYSAARPKSSVSRIQIDASYLEDYDDRTLTEALTKESRRFRNIKQEWRNLRDDSPTVC